MKNIRITNTPYDDVFRTLLNDCSPLIILVINEVFGEHYSGQEKIIFSPNEPTENPFRFHQSVLNQAVVHDKI